MRSRACIRIALLTALVLAACAPAAGASVFVGHSGWFWGSPLPQGNTLRAIDFTGTRGYAVGDFGTVLRSDDGGATWSGLTTGTTVPLRVVRIITPDVVVVAGKCELRRSNDAGASFTSLPWVPAGSPCKRQIRSVAFPTSQVGYLVLSDGSVLRTHDGGRTWTTQTAIPGTPATNTASTNHPTDIVFTTADMGFATSESGSIYRTTDDGTSWSPVVTAPQHLDNIVFPDAQDGYAVGGTSLVSTHDGGKTWSQQGLVSQDESLAWIRCRDTVTCITATASGDQLLRRDTTTRSWTSISPATKPLFAAAFAAPSPGSDTPSVVAVGQDGTTVLSKDGGQNFTNVSEGLGSTFTLLRGGAAAVAYIAGQAGAIAKTADGGRTWTPLAPPLADDIVDLAFPTNSTGFSLSPGNVLMRTTDAGQTWQLLDVGTFVPAKRIYALDETTLLLVMQRGLRISTDGGMNFVRIRDNPVGTSIFNGAGRAGAGALFAFGPRAIVVSSDGGQDWRAGRVPERHVKVKLVRFVNANVAYALTFDGRLWRSADGARHWHELPALGSEIGTDIAFGDARDGYVAVPEFGDNKGGYLMRTDDGGTTWRPQLVDSAPLTRDALAAAGPNSAMAVAGGSHLLATTRGGDIGVRSALTLSVVRERPGKRGVIALNGTLDPASGGETVVVSERSGRSSHWLYRDATVSSTGRFTVFASLRRTTSFVAQWAGDDDHEGAGTTVITIGVGHRYTQRRFSASSQPG